VSFNGEFRARRLVAAARGKPFPGYALARARLTKVLANVAGGGDAKETIARVFKDGC
jgi:hypothetical protein